MREEIAYATTKAALAGVTAPWRRPCRRGIVLNTVNPGPVNTGYLDEDVCPHAERSRPCANISRPADSASPTTRRA